MISKERLETLIREGGMIYTLDYNRLLNMEISPDTDTKKIIIGELFLDDDIFITEDKLYKYNWCISLDKLFETKEDAEFALRFKRIPKTEYLDLPFFEEIQEYYILEFSNSRFIVDIFENRILVMTNKNYLDLYDYIFDKPATKENYLEACEICRKLWLGEK